MSLLQQLYDSEINFSITTFWDGGVTAKLGDEINGYVAEEIFEKVIDAEMWLLGQARIHFPESKFANL